MLIESYEIEVKLSSHSMQEPEYEVIAHLDVDLRPVIPYLNAVLRHAIYSTHRCAIVWKHEGHKIGIWPDQIAIDHIHAREEANKILQHVVEMINQTWDKRGEIEPKLDARRFLQPLEVYELLPKTNCKVCGESTCFIFALKIATGQIHLDACTPLRTEPQWAYNTAQLQKLLDTKSPSL